MSNRAQITDLVLKHIEGVLDEKGSSDLSTLLSADEEARRIYVQEMRLHAALLIKGKSWKSGNARDRAAALPSFRAKGHSPFRRIVALAASLAILIGGAIGLLDWQKERSSIATLRSVTASVTVTHKDRTVTAQDGMRLFAGDFIQASQPGEPRIEYKGELTTMVLSKACLMRLDMRNGARTVDLENGALACTVAKQPEGKPMRFITPNAEAKVLGTELELSVARDSTELKVTTGNVLLTRLSDSASVNVAASQYATVAPGIEFIVHSIQEQKPQEVEKVAMPKETVVYLREFNAIPPSEWSDNELVRLKEADGEVTAMMSMPYQYSTATWKPDAALGWCRVASDVPEDKVLYTIPDNVEIRIRIKSEKPGKFTFCQAPADPHFEQEHFYTDGLQVTNGWREIVLRASDMKPYVAEGEGESRDFVAGVDIGHIGIYGYGTGKLYLGRFEVLSVSKQ